MINLLLKNFMSYWWNSMTTVISITFQNSFLKFYDFPWRVEVEPSVIQKNRQTKQQISAHADSNSLMFESTDLWDFKLEKNTLLTIPGGAMKTGPPSHCKHSETPWPNCVEIGELMQYYMLNTVINILFKNFIALWRQLAKTKLLSFIHIVQIDLSIKQ